VTALVLLTVWAGCESPDAFTDAGADGAVDGGMARTLTIAPPEIPWLDEGVPPIGLTPCPEGWREVVHGDVVECDPYPSGGPSSCAIGEAHFPGEPGCRSVGDPCPAGTFAEGLSGTVIYVDASAEPGGDGSMALPFSALSDVRWGSLATGSTVAIGRGRYAGVLPLRAGISVVGACAAETTVTGIYSPVPAVVTVSGRGDAPTIRNLSIADAPQAGVRATGALRIEGVVVSATSGVGVLVSGSGADVVMNDVLIRDVPVAPDGSVGHGLFALDSGVVSGSRVVILGSEDDGIHAQVGGQITLVDSAVVRGEDFGVVIRGGSTFEATNLAVLSNHSVGIYVDGTDSAATLVHAVVRDTAPGLVDGLGGRALAVHAGGRLDANALLVAGDADDEILVEGVGSTASVVDAVIRGVIDGDESHGRGVTVQAGAQFDATRALVVDAHLDSIFGADEGSLITLTDVAIVRTQPDPANGDFGRAIELIDGAQVVAERLLLSENHDAALFVRGDGVSSEAVITDAVIRDTRPRPMDSLYGQAVTVAVGGHVAATRLRVEESTGLGLAVDGEGSTMTLTDVSVLDTRPSEADGREGRGITVQSGASLVGRRVEVDGAYEIGIASAFDADTDLSEVRVSRVRRASCQLTTCPGQIFGHGVVAVAGSMRLTNFEIDDAEVCGVFLARSTGGALGAEPSVDLATGLITRSAIGACVQVAGYDVDRLMTGVVYRDNELNLDATMLPVPDPAVLVE